MFIIMFMNNLLMEFLNRIHQLTSSLIVVYCSVEDPKFKRYKRFLSLRSRGRVMMI